MDIIIERGCGIDEHKRTVVAVTGYLALLSLLLSLKHGMFPFCLTA